MSGFANTLIGMTLGGYTIRRMIARGGMGIVYEGLQESLSRRVAVKVMYPHLGEDASFRERFQREARAIAQLRHPNIVGVIDFGTDQGYHFMVMELIDGPSLRDELSRRHELRTPFSTDESLTILRSIASALTYAHGRGMIHRDVKPANVMLGPDGDVFLTDFGLVKLADAQNVTIAGMIVGTPEYMAPEQSAGPVDVTPAADQYSLAVVAYQLLVGRVPFTAPTPVGVIQKHISEPPPPPHTVVPTFPRDIERVLMRALAKDPGDRFPTVDVFFRDLDRAARSSMHVAAPVQQIVPDTITSTPVEVTIVDLDDAGDVAASSTTVPPRFAGSDEDTVRVARPASVADAASLASSATPARGFHASPAPTHPSYTAAGGSGGYGAPPATPPYMGLPERRRNPLVFVAAAVGLALALGCVGVLAFVVGGGNFPGSASAATSTPSSAGIATQAATLSPSTSTSAAPAATTTSPAPTATLASQASTPTPVAATPTPVAPTPTAVAPTPTPVIVQAPGSTPTRIIIDPVTATPTSGSGVAGWDLLLDERFEDGTQFFTGETSGGVNAFVRGGWYGVEVPQNRWQTFTASWLEPIPEGFIGSRIQFRGNGYGGVVAKSWTVSDTEYTFYVCWLGTDGSAGCSYVVNNEWTSLYRAPAGTIELQETNLVTVQIDGTSLTFRVNEADVATGIEVDADTGYWGVFAQSASDETNFVAWYYDVRIFVRSQ